MMRRTITPLALLVVTLLAFDAAAQEFARAFGGEINGTAKQSRDVSGSLAFTRSDRGFGDRYDATLGGSLSGDRLWFFASATMMPSQSIDWRNVKLATPQTSAPAELPTSFFTLRSTNLFSDTTVLNLNVSRY